MILLVLTAPVPGKLTTTGTASFVGARAAKVGTVCKSRTTIKVAGAYTAMCRLTSVAQRAAAKKPLKVTIVSTLVGSNGITYTTKKTIAYRKSKS